MKRPTIIRVSSPFPYCNKFRNSKGFQNENDRICGRPLHWDFDKQVWVCLTCSKE